MPKYSTETSHKAQHSQWDLLAMTLSGICVIHCLTLPFLIFVLPTLASFFESPLIHRLLLTLAIPISLFAFFRSETKTPPRILMVAILGLILLGTAAYFVEWHDIEQPLSLIGASLVASAHFINARHSH